MASSWPRRSLDSSLRNALFCGHWTRLKHSPSASPAPQRATSPQLAKNSAKSCGKFHAGRIASKTNQKVLRAKLTSCYDMEPCCRINCKKRESYRGGDSRCCMRRRTAQTMTSAPEKTLSKNEQNARESLRPRG